MCAKKVRSANVCVREKERKESEQEGQKKMSVITLLSGIRREFCPVPVFPLLPLGMIVSSRLPRQHFLNHTVKTKYCCYYW